jgi:hypothetical protein
MRIICVGLGNRPVKLLRLGQPTLAVQRQPLVEGSRRDGGFRRPAVEEAHDRGR